MKAIGRSLSSGCQAAAGCLVLLCSVAGSAQPLRDPMAGAGLRSATSADPSEGTNLPRPPDAGWTGYSLVKGVDGRWRLFHEGRLWSVGDEIRDGCLVRIDESGLALRSAAGMVLVRPHEGVSREWMGSPARASAVTPSRRSPAMPPCDSRPSRSLPAFRPRPIHD